MEVDCSCINLFFFFFSPAKFLTNKEKTGTKNLEISFTHTRAHTLTSSPNLSLINIHAFLSVPFILLSSPVHLSPSLNHKFFIRVSTYKSYAENKDAELSREDLTRHVNSFFFFPFEIFHVTLQTNAVFCSFFFFFFR